MKLSSHQNKIISNRQYVVLMSIIVFGIMVIPFSITINVKRETYEVAVVQILLLLSCVWLFFYVKKLSDYRVFMGISAAILFSFFSLTVYMTYNPSSSPGTFFFIFTVPTLAYVMLGKTYGCIMSFFFGALTLVTYYFSDKVNPGFQVLNTYNATVTFLIVWCVSHVYEKSNVTTFKVIQKSSMTDSLTQLYNRHVIAEIDSFYQNSTVLSYIIIDIDLFKKVNDNYGHDTGDAVLVFLAEELKKWFDDVGYVIRLGGEEFSIILPNKSIVQARELCEKCLAEINKKSIRHDDKTINITFSAGIASSAHDGSNYSELLKVADQRLYKAKNSGRNCVVSQ